MCIRDSDSTVPLITMEVPFGNWNYLGRQIKAKVKAPVIMGMRQYIKEAEEVVERGDFDGVVREVPDYLPEQAANAAELCRPARDAERCLLYTSLRPR